MEKISTVRDLIALWPSRKALAEDIGASIGEGLAPERVHKWAQSGAIPARYHQSIIDAAHGRGFDVVNATLIVRLHASIARDREDAA